MSVRTTASTVTFDHVALHLPEGTLMGTVTYGRRRRLLELHDPLAVSYTHLTLPTKRIV